MERCTFCGAERNADYHFCPFCGLPFSEKKPAKVRRVKVPLSLSDKKALAGFLLSFFGLLTLASTPVQVVGLILSLSARGATRCKIFRRFGIILGAVSLVVSILLWTEFLLHMDVYLFKILKSMYY